MLFLYVYGRINQMFPNVLLTNPKISKQNQKEIRMQQAIKIMMK
jgi:hypothetical protein